MRSIIISLFLAAFQIGSAMAETSQIKAGTAFGNWVFQCSAVAQNATKCALVQTIVAGADKHKIAQIQFVEPVEGSSPQMSLLLPLGLDLQSPVTVQIDTAKPVALAPKTCIKSGCLFAVGLDATFAASLAAGTKLSVQFSLANGKKDVGFGGSLTGLTDAFAAVAWF